MSRKRQETINCDVPGCQQVKGDSNHWFSVHYSTTNGPMIEVTSLLEEDEVLDGDKDFCGEACLIKGLPAFIRRLNGVQ